MFIYSILTVKHSDTGYARISRWFFQTHTSTVVSQKIMPVFYLMLQSLSFITTSSTAALLHRKPASARSLCDSCGAQDSDGRHTVCTS
jgi:hypothetical protein